MPVGTTQGSSADPGAEREIDLGRWRRGLVAHRWVIVGGLVAGLVIGVLYSLSGGTAYSATALVAPGQAFNPSGSSNVLTYLTSQTAINTIATSVSTLDGAAKAAGMDASGLRGHVTTSAVNQGTSTASSSKNAVLVSITVQLGSKQHAEDAANAIAAIVQRETTSRYVNQSFSIYGVRNANFNARLKTLQVRVNALSKALAQPGLTLDQSLLLAIQLDQSQATQDQTTGALSTNQQQQILAEDVERTQIIQDAVAGKTAIRSRRNTVIIGALLGLLAGILAATILGRRPHSARL